MSEFLGTKTKWKSVVNEKWPFNWYLETEDGESNILIGINHYSTRDDTIQDCLNRDYEINSEGLANLLLISKAPEMLEMLNEMYDEWCETGIGENKLSEYMIKTNQLIKEATTLCETK
jgi:hypothetical protein